MCKAIDDIYEEGKIEGRAQEREELIIRLLGKGKSVEEISDIWQVQKYLYPNTGLLVTNPIPEEYSMDPVYINKEIDEAIREMNKLGIKGKETTPFLLDKIQKLTGGESLESNIMLVLNNARLASRIAAANCRK